MKTLIELYDERPLENVLSSEVFSPEHTVFICSQEIARNKKLHAKLREYFHRRNVKTNLVFIKTDMFNTSDILEKLKSVVTNYPKCAIDITGGTDASLFACGQLCSTTPIPVFTYSRKRNKFFNIANAPFADDLTCNIQYDIEDFFLMAGGAARTGKVDNSILKNYLQYIDPLFSLFLSYHKDWLKIVMYMQRCSNNQEHESLIVDSNYTVKGERGSRISANESALKAMENIGLLEDLRIVSGTSVSFKYHDKQTRAWLRDVGSILELYIYKTCLDMGIFHDVRTSVIVDWDSSFMHNNVTNELDVMASCGVFPIFISCKINKVKTEALNELAILRDRFGGQSSRAAIVTAENGGSAMRHRASELDIDVIDLKELLNGTYKNHLYSLAKCR